MVRNNLYGISNILQAAGQNNLLATQKCGEKSIIGLINPGNVDVYVHRLTYIHVI